MEDSLVNGFRGDWRKEGDEERACQGTEASGSAKWDGDVVGGSGADGDGGLVGAYVGRNALGLGRVLLGKVISYDGTSRQYRIIYENGHQEDVERELVGKILMLDDGVGRLTQRKRRLDRIIPLGGLNRRTTRSRKGSSDDPASFVQVSSEDIVRDADSSSDSCDHARVPAEASISYLAETQILPLKFPPSSGDIVVPEGSISHLFSTYNFLRSFSLQLFLSPFGLDDYVGSLNCTVQNSLMDAIHLSVMRALGRHLQTLSSDGPNLASKCLRFYDWTFLDMLTWPAFLIEYLYVMGYMKELDSKEFIDSALHGEYYGLTVPTKLKVLQLLCDDVINSGELRTELGMRVGMEDDIEEGSDVNLISEDVPTSLHHKTFKISDISGWKDSVVSDESGILGNQQVYNKISEAGVDESANSQDKNSDECCLCGMDGTLICCDGCPSAYHSRCIGLNKAFLPDGLWFCPECSINKLGPTSSRIGRGARGAEVFGTDYYGRIFVGTCNYLLVLGSSLNEEPIDRYYNQDDIAKVLDLFSSTQANILAYANIILGISKYFEVPMVTLNAERFDSTNILNNSGDDSASSIMISNFNHSVVKDDGNEDPASSVLVQVGISDAQANLMECHDACVNKIPAISEGNLIPSNSENPSSRIIILTDPKVQLSQQIEMREKPSFGSAVTDLSHANPALPAEKSNLFNNFAFSSGNGSDICKEDADSAIYSTKNGSSGACYESKNLFNTYDATPKNTNDRGSNVPFSFKPMSYINQYIQGDIAASAAASLAVLSAKDSTIASMQSSSNQRKLVAATTALQMKAFSAAVMNFVWPCAEKKLVDVPRERCGWCIACKSPPTNKKGCLLNLAASNAIKGPARNGNLRTNKHHESHLPDICAQLLIMEETLRGLIVGPFLDDRGGKQWRKQVKEASSCRFLKSLVLQLERNIRGIAFSGGWTKMMDDLIENPKLSNGIFRTGGNQKLGSGAKRGRKPSKTTIASSDDSCKHLQWWRGGKLSKAILQTGTISGSLAKKAARQGGKRRLAGISYHECSAYCRRSRQFAWRAAVEMSSSTSQLALQVRYLDSHIRWKDFTRPEQIVKDVKGSETDIMVFRNAFISDKKIWDNKILYALNFGDQKHLPSRITKTVLESEKALDGAEKLWFSEVHLPLYLIKEYEEKVGTCQEFPVSSTVHNNMVKFYKRGLKYYWGNVFSYLVFKRENPMKCPSCQKDVHLRLAAKCRACEDFCHLACSVPSVLKQEDDPDFSRMCKSCYSSKFPSSIESSQRACSTKPSLLQKYQLLSVPGMSAIPQTRPCTTSLPVSKKEVNSDSRSSKLTSCSKGKTKRKGGTWFTYGIVWKRKKHGPDGGKEFRMENILLKVKNGSSSSRRPICCLCEMPYNSNLMYVCCERCNKWCHADAVLLDESIILDVVGFICCKCRRKSSPKCPYAEIGYMKLEEPLSDNAVEIGDAMQILPKSGSSATSISNSETDNFGMVDSDPFLNSLDKVEPVDEAALEMDDKFLTSIRSFEGRQKLCGRSHANQEDFDEWYAGQIGNSMHEASSHSPQNIPLQSPQNIPSSSHIITSQMMPSSSILSFNDQQNLSGRSQVKQENFDECYVGQIGNPLHEKSQSSKNIPVPSLISASWKMPSSLELDDIEFDGHHNLGLQNMHKEENLPGPELSEAGNMPFEPQTYFSFTELLASADDVPMGFIEQQDATITMNDYCAGYSDRAYHCLSGQIESNVSDEFVFGGVECQKCRLCIPSPDLICEICRLCIHSHCSPWVEDGIGTSTGSKWRCGNCREWK